MSLKHKEYKEANERFLKENLTEEEVMELPCGVQYKILLRGNGPVPTAKSTVKVHYRGTLIDGKVFDDSFAGSRWIIYIPYELGYGTRACGNIPAYSTLIFEVELQGVKG